MHIVINAVIAIAALCLFAIIPIIIANQPFSFWFIPVGILSETLCLLILGRCYAVYREDRYHRAARDTHPDAPWMWDQRWRSEIMLSRSKAEFWGTLAATIILGLIALAGGASLLSGLAEGNLWVLLNLVPIAATAYLGWKTYIAWETLRFERHISLFNETCPAWVGARFSARMQIADGHHPENVDVWLEHWKTIRSRHSNEVTLENVVDRKVLGTVEAVGTGRLKISVDIPETSPATSWRDEEQKSWWDLVISIRMAGAVGPIRYEIPVAEPRTIQNRRGC